MRRPASNKLSKTSEGCLGETLVNKRANFLRGMQFTGQKRDESLSGYLPSFGRLRQQDHSELQSPVAGDEGMA